MLHRLRQAAGRLDRPTWGALASVSVWQVSNYLLPLLTFPYLARVLGVHGFGYLGIALAVSGIVLVIVDWGFAYSSSREVARVGADPEAINRIVWATWTLRFAIAVPVVLVAVVATTLLVADGLLRQAILASLVAVAGSVLSLEWALRGTESFRAFATTSVLGRLLLVPFFYIFVHSPADVWISALLSSSSAAIVALLTVIVARHARIVRRPDLNARLIRGQFVESGYLFISALLSTATSSGVSLILAAVAGTGQAGLFSGADRTKWPFVSLLNPIIMVAYPRLSAMAGHSAADAEEAARNLLRLNIAAGTVVAAGLFALAPLVVAVLLGDGFGEVVPVLRVLCWAIVFVAANTVLGLLVLLPMGATRYYAATLLLGTVVALGAAPIFCSLWGALGAACCVVAAEAAVTVASIVAVWRTRPGVLRRSLAVAR